MKYLRTSMIITGKKQYVRLRVRFPLRYRYVACGYAGGFMLGGGQNCVISCIAPSLPCRRRLGCGISISEITYNYENQCKFPTIMVIYHFFRIFIRIKRKFSMFLQPPTLTSECGEAGDPY